MNKYALLLLCSALYGAQALEVGTNCLAITCESMEGKCCDRSDLELKVTLADNCSKWNILLIANINGQISSFQKFLFLKS